MKYGIKGAHFCSLKLSLKTHIVMLHEPEGPGRVLEGVWSWQAVYSHVEYAAVESCLCLPQCSHLFGSLFSWLLIFIEFIQINSCCRACSVLILCGDGVCSSLSSGDPISTSVFGLAQSCPSPVLRSRAAADRQEKPTFGSIPEPCAGAC